MYIIPFLLATLIGLFLLVITYTVVSHRARLKPMGALVVCVLLGAMLFLADTADKMKQQERFDERMRDIQQYNQ